VDKAVEQRLVARLTDIAMTEDFPTLPKWIRRLVETGDDKEALSLVDYLNSAPDSPWLQKIAIPNRSAERTTVSQKTFVTNIKKYVLTGANPLVGWPIDQRQKIFLNYWRAIADELGSDEETVLFKSIGVDLFCRFSGSLFNKLASGKNFSVQTMRAELRKAFDNLEGDYAGLAHPDWWLSGTGPAGRLNASALGRINQDLAVALHRNGGAVVL
jgi:hypothetical protein